MGLFEKIFGNRPKKEKAFDCFKMLNGYTPNFTSYNGSIYESQLIRSAINVRALHIGKLKVELSGAARPALQSKLKHAPNQFQTWYQFMYRLSTILDIHNTAFICPVYDKFGEPSGIVTPLPHRCEIVDVNGVPYLRYEFSDGKKNEIYYRGYYKCTPWDLLVSSLSIVGYYNANAGGALPEVFVGVSAAEKVSSARVRKMK